MTAEAILSLIISTSLIEGVDPRVAVAVATVESSLIPTAVGKHGEIGLFQIMPYHGAVERLHDTETNILLGIGLLKNALTKCADMGKYAVICYNQGSRRRPKHPEKHPYYLKVSKHV